MRIVFLLLHDFRFASHGFQDFASGRFHFSKEYARRMAAAGHDVKLYVLDGSLRGRTIVQADGYELKGFRTSLRFPPLARFGNDHSLDVLRELDRDSPDVVHFHNYYLWSFPYLAPWVKRRGIPLVAQFHGTDPIRTFKAVAYSPPLRLCDLVLVPLRSELAFLTRRMRLPKDRIAMFPSTGVDTTMFRRTRPPDDEPILLYVGRVPLASNYHWEKAPQYLIPMLRALRRRGLGVRLQVVGDGPGLASMKELAASQGVSEGVDFLGEMEHAGLPDLYSRARIAFVPIELDELGPYWGGTVQETLACGTPPVGLNARSPGFRRLGLLVPPAAAPAAALISTALHDRPWYESIDREGPDSVRDRADWGAMTRRLESIYERLTRGRD